MVRRLDDTAATQLEAMQGSPLLAEGGVNLIGLDAVKDRLGARWESRRNQVYEHVEQVLTRNLGPTGYFLRTSETDYLITAGGLGAFGAQCACLRSLTEILVFFVGPGQRRDISVHQVTRVSGKKIVATPVNAEAALKGHEREQRAARSRASEADSLFAPERWSPFIASSGRRVRVSCVLEPIFELKNHTRIGYRLRRRVLDMATEKPLSDLEVSHLSRGDLLRIDMATIARGLARLKSGDGQESELSLIVPVSFVSLSHHEGRDLLTRGFAQARETVLRGVICEIQDIDSVPQMALTSAVSQIKDCVLFSIGHITAENPQGLAGLKNTGLHALSIDCPANLGGDAEFIGWLRAAIGAARRVTRAVMVYGCASPRRAAMAAHLGASHASFGNS
ncbi:hypothetical protein BH11PSE2_BH11PSE2_13270 [soil metagenome]